MTGMMIVALVVFGLLVAAVVVAVARELAMDGYRPQRVRVDYDSRHPVG